MTDSSAGSAIQTVSATVDGQKCVAHVPEPDMASAADFLRRLRSGQAVEPFVLDVGEHRYLQFGLRYVQSQMHIRDPDRLVLAYTRKIMSFLLFKPQPKHIVLIGLGGGSLTKYCYRRLPGSRITTVEISQAVIDLGGMFKVPAPNGRLRILCTDGASYIRSTRRSLDVVVIDGCDRHGIAPSLCDPSFYAAVRARLSPGGVMVVNLVGTVGRSDALIGDIARAFDGRVLTLSVARGGNRIVLALQQDADWPPDWPTLERRAVALKKQFDLDFPAYLKKLERAAHFQTVASPPPSLTSRKQACQKRKTTAKSG